MAPTSKLQDLLDSGVQRRIFPSAQAAVLHQGAPVFQGIAGDVRPETLFDLASLTKVICTTAAFMALWDEQRVSPDTDLSTFFPKTAVARAQLSLADLLYHRSGLPAFVPFFAPVMGAFPALFSPGCAPAIRERTARETDRKSTRLNSSHQIISYAVFCLKK